MIDVDAGELAFIILMHFSKATDNHEVIIESNLKAGNRQQQI